MLLLPMIIGHEDWEIRSKPEFSLSCHKFLQGPSGIDSFGRTARIELAVALSPVPITPARNYNNESIPKYSDAVLPTDLSRFGGPKYTVVSMPPE